MKNLPKILIAVIILGGLGYFFYTKSQDKESVVSEIASTPTSDSTATSAISQSDYEYIPRTELFDGTTQSNAILEELKNRYKTNFEEFVNNAKSTGAKIVFCWITTEPTIKMNVVGKVFIRDLCKANGVDFVDFVPLIENKKPQDITFYPVDGHFNQNGAKIIAGEMAKYILKNEGAKSTATYTERPKLFGDAEPNQNTVTDGGKNLPYKLITNSQGLRMDYDLTFPKTKQRVLLMGDSAFEFPFLDNPKTGSGLLQAQFPGKEILNAAKLGYSVDDYNSLWSARLKYTEPDIIFLQSSGDDIADMFFSHRLRFSRTPENIKPSAEELAYYKAVKK